MGNLYSRQQEQYKFGGYNNKDKPRPGYFIQGENVYYNGSTINVDIQSFEKLGYGYAKDKNKVFYKGLVISNANPKKFITINRNELYKYKNVLKYNSVLGKDNHGFYLKGKLIK